MFVILHHSFKLFTIKFGKYKMSKSLGFIILAMLLVASTQSIFISSFNTDLESKPCPSFSTNSAASPDSGSCLGLTTEECIAKSLEGDYTLFPVYRCQ